MKHRINLFLTFLTPIAAALGIVYQLIIGKEISFIIILIGILPGAILSALKELKATLPPDKLIIQIDSKLYTIVDQTIEVREVLNEAIQREKEKENQRRSRHDYESEGQFISRVPKYSQSDFTEKMISQGNTDISIPIRLRNRDFERKINVIDIKVAFLNKDLEMTNSTHADDLIFNNAKNKTIEPTSRGDYKIKLSHKGKQRDQYRIFISFNDNFERFYKKELIINNIK